MSEESTMYHLVKKLRKEVEDLKGSFHSSQGYPISTFATSDRKKYGTAEVLHPFSGFNTQDRINEIHQSLSQLKSLATSHHKNLLATKQAGQLTENIEKLKPGLNLSKVQELTNIEQSRVLMKEKWATVLNKSKRKLGWATLNEKWDKDIYLVEALKLVAHDLKLEIYVDKAEDKTTVTLCGKILVIDITIINDSASEVNIVHTSSDKELEDMNSLLLKNLKESKLTEFQNNLLRLSWIDCWLDSYKNIDAFHQAIALFKDLETIFKLELKESNGNSIKHFEFGHGLPLLFHYGIGPTLVYWQLPNASNKLNQINLEDIANDEQFKKGYFKVHLQLEKSTALKPAVRNEWSGLVNCPISNEEAYKYGFKKENCNLSPLAKEVSLLKVSGSEVDSSACLPIKWSIKLEPPVVVSKSAILKLNKILNIDFDISKHNGDGMFFTNLLKIGEVNIKSNQNANSCFFGKFKSSNYLQRYTIEEDQVPSFVLSELPLSQIDQIQPILMCLRQQLKFNYIFLSFFNSSTFMPSLINKINQPGFLKSYEIVDIAIRLEENSLVINSGKFGKLIVQSNGMIPTIEFNSSYFTSIDSSILSNYNNILNKCLNGPLVIALILKLISNNS